MAPRTQPGPSTRARVHGIAKGLPNGPDVGHQAIGTDQQGTMGRTAPHALDQSSDQRHVPLRTDFAAQPQTRLDHHGQRHPHDAALFLHADLVGLHLPQVARLLDQMFLHRLSLIAGTCHPTRYRPLVIAKCDDDRLEGTPVGQERHYQAHRLRRGPQAIEGRAFRGAERLLTRCAEKALVLARVDANVTLAGLSSGGACHIGAACCCGVHACVLRVALGNVPRGSMPGPPFSLPANHTTVSCGATHAIMGRRNGGIDMNHLKNLARNAVSIFLFRFELRGNGIDFVLNEAIAADMYPGVDKKLKPLVHACCETLLRYKHLSVSNTMMDGSILATG